MTKYNYSNYVGGTDFWMDFNGITFKVGILLTYDASAFFRFQGGPVQRKYQVQRADDVLSDQH